MMAIDRCRGSRCGSPYVPSCCVSLTVNGANGGVDARIAEADRSSVVAGVVPGSSHWKRNGPSLRSDSNSISWLSMIEKIALWQLIAGRSRFPCCSMVSGAGSSSIRHKTIINYLNNNNR